MTNQNARKGEYFEDLFCREIVRNPQNIREIVEASSESVPTNLKIILVEREGQHGDKSDVFIRTTGGHNFGVSIKAFQGTGFNQVTRMKIGTFIELFSLSNEVRHILEQSTIRKARNSNVNWISREDSDFIVRVLNHSKRKIKL